jgi:hypothetical protein
MVGRQRGLVVEKGDVHGVEFGDSPPRTRWRGVV